MNNDDRILGIDALLEMLTIDGIRANMDYLENVFRIAFEEDLTRNERSKLQEVYDRFDKIKLLM